ncbi:thioesterase-like protein, partial [Trifolium pratense]
GRHEFLKSIGIHCDVVASSGDNAFAMSELSLKFIAPLRNGDKFVVKVKVSSFSTVRVYFDHFIYKLPNQEPILEAKSTTLVLNKNYRPIRLPEDIKAKIVNSFSSDDDAS